MNGSTAVERSFDGFTQSQIERKKERNRNVETLFNDDTTKNDDTTVENVLARYTPEYSAMQLVSSN
jgi:hypothetical protein